MATYQSWIRVGKTAMNNEIYKEIVSIQHHKTKLDTARLFLPFHQSLFCLTIKWNEIESTVIIDE